MTIIEHNLPGLIEPWIGQKIGIRWTSTRIGSSALVGGAHGHRPVRCDFVLMLEMVDRGRATLEGWIESARGREAIVRRRSVAVEVLQDGDLLHIDAAIDVPKGESASITLCRRAGATGEGELVYAQTSLLRRAGFAAGAHDPPSAFRIPD